MWFVKKWEYFVTRIELLVVISPSMKKKKKIHHYFLRRKMCSLCNFHLKQNCDLRILWQNPHRKRKPFCFAYIMSYFLDGAVPWLAYRSNMAFKRYCYYFFFFKPGEKCFFLKLSTLREFWSRKNCCPFLNEKSENLVWQ